MPEREVGLPAEDGPGFRRANFGGRLRRTAMGLLETCGKAVDGDHMGGRFVVKLSADLQAHPARRCQRPQHEQTRSSVAWFRLSMATHRLRQTPEVSDD